MLSSGSASGGKRRATGPAVRRPVGERRPGGARKAAPTKQPVVRRGAGSPVPAIAPVKVDKVPREDRLVRHDARLALQRTVEAAGEVFRPGDWSFDSSTFLSMVARRRSLLGRAGTGWLSPMSATPGG